MTIERLIRERAKLIERIAAIDAELSAAARVKRWFWLSFYSTQEGTARRGTQPFWSWCTGYTMDEPTRCTICCLVEDVKDERAAWALVRKWFPVGEIRFCEECERGWNPNTGGRFPGYVPPPEFAAKGGE